jgi:hypothetical protein
MSMAAIIPGDRPDGGSKWKGQVGCAGVRWETTYSSVPTLLPSETWSQTEDGMFATAGMKVRVEAYNHRGGGEWVAGVVFLVPIVYPVGNSWKQERPFRIHVTFDATGRDFAFDPRRVTLASETIRPMAPTDPDAGAPRLVPELSAFDLTFDIEPPDPEREFTLLLDGLARGNMPVPPLRIRFKPNQRTRTSP